MTRERKYILIGGMILLLLGAIYRFSPDVGDFQLLGDEIAMKERKVVKYRLMAQKRNELDARLISLNRAIERAESGLLTGETPALAAVDIQNILNDIGGRSEVEIQSMRILKPKKPDKDSPAKGRYLSIPVQITLNANIRQLKEVLYSIETSSKLLRISDMRVRVRNIRQTEQIYSTLTVEGFMKLET
ncbi:type II secretion system protein GspM [Desulfonema magnum]|uniref:Type II secretion system protein, protein M n=1 Tax=Desulfonema magnum TaxID=45655 RepID=A0A975GK94_9BACT|nr:type II secretion system protein GspM [Desulfonema magnum]QTA84509.1 Type II secretion system protein, protein M [Desulfonema magnum]